jgi:phage-related protein
MIAWTLWQYRSIVESFLAQCDIQMQEIFVRRLAILLERGNECKMPISEPLGDGLFALRSRSKNRRARLIYYFGENKQIIFVHAFYKSTSKVKQDAIRIAKRNRNIIKEEKERPYGYNFIS